MFSYQTAKKAYHHHLVRSFLKHFKPTVVSILLITLQSSIAISAGLCFKHVQEQRQSRLTKML